MSTSGPYGAEWIQKKLSDEEAVDRAIRAEEIRVEAERQKRTKKFKRWSNIAGFPGTLLFIVGGLALASSLFVMLFSIALDTVESVLWAPRVMACGALMFLPGQGLLKLAAHLEKKAK